MKIRCLVNPMPMSALPKTNEPLFATFFWNGGGARYCSQVQEFTSDHIRSHPEVEWQAWSYFEGFIEQHNEEPS